MAEIVAAMSGNVWKIVVNENDEVKEGDVVVILESMKMEIPIEATQDGIVASIEINEGDFVQEGDCLIKLNTQ